MESADDQAVESSESAVDRISSLPTEIQHNILSLVCMRTVVRMRRLSRRWRHLCESLQFICLKTQDFKSWSNAKFTRFLNNLFLLRAKVDLHTFQLHWSWDRSLECNDVMMWIAYAVKHNVKVLDVDVNGYDRSFLPHCIFTCPSLQELNLNLERDSYGGYRPMLPATINLPSLRKLTLANVEISQVSLNQIIAQSPGLEDLDLANCAAYFNLIDSKVLKRLTLNGFYDVMDGFIVAAPQLIYFKCIGFPLEDIAWRGQPSLESAHIETNGDTYDAQSGFTGIISQAKRLELSFDGSDLKLSPRLQKLIIRHGELCEAGQGAGKDATLSSEMAFQCPHLQTVLIYCSKGDDGINTMVNAIVANGIDLEKIKITYYEDLMQKCLVEANRMKQEQREEFGIFEKTLKENPEWVDDNCAGSESDDDDDNDDDDDDEWGDEDEDDESGDEDVDDESGDEDEEEDEENDDKMEVEDGRDDDMEDGVDNEQDNWLLRDLKFDAAKKPDARSKHTQPKNGAR
ncbi:hypothetical protein EJB05_16702, partial [Eragrostis curvula]